FNRLAVKLRSTREECLLLAAEQPVYLEEQSHKYGYQEQHEVEDPLVASTSLYLKQTAGHARQAEDDDNRKQSKSRVSRLARSCETRAVSRQSSAKYHRRQHERDRSHYHNQKQAENQLNPSEATNLFDGKQSPSAVWAYAHYLDCFIATFLASSQIFGHSY